MSKVLRANPMDFTLVGDPPVPTPAVFFRTCVIGIRTTLVVGSGLPNINVPRMHLMDAYFLNNGDEDLVISALALTTGTRFAAEFVTLGPLPITLKPRQNTLLKLGFFPLDGDEGTLLEDTITITHDGDNGPTYEFAVSGYGVAPGQALLNFSPFAWSFDWTNSRFLVGGSEVGTFGNVFNLILYNSGDELLTVTHISPRWPFSLTAPLPQLPMVLAPASSAVIHLKVFVELAGLSIYNGEDFPVALEVVSNSEAERVSEFVAAVTGLPIVSAFSLTGTDKPALASFGHIMYEFDPSNLEPELPAKLVKVFDMGLGRNEKLLARLLFRYEDLGPAVFHTTVRTQDETSVLVSKAIGTVAADGFIRRQLVEEQLNENLFELTIEHFTGPLSFVDCAIDFEVRGPVVD